MTKKQENILSMFAPVENILRANESIWSGMPGMVAAHNNFLAAWNIIDPDAQKQMNGTTGTTTDKQVAREELVRLALLVSGNNAAYAKMNRMAGLEEEMTFSKSGFERMRDNVLLVTARMIREKTVALGGQAAGYGNDEAMIQVFSDSIAGFESGAGAPRQIKSGLITATKNIGANLKACVESLEVIDKLIENFRKDQPVFISNYFNARKVIDLGHRKSQPKSNTPPAPAS